MRMTRKELREIMGEATRQYIQLSSGVRFRGDDTPLDEAERRALCHLLGAARFLYAKGFIAQTFVDDLDPELENVDSELETEGV